MLETWLSIFVTASQTVGGSMMEKRAMKCLDGPYVGHTLWVTDYQTAVIVVNGEIGKYAFGKWYAIH